MPVDNQPVIPHCVLVPTARTHTHNRQGTDTMPTRRHITLPNPHTDSTRKARARHQRAEAIKRIGVYTATLIGCMGMMLFAIVFALFISIPTL